MATKNKLISMSKGNDELRFEPFKMRSGETVGSLRVFYKDKSSGEMKPGKQGLTLKKSEVPEFVKKLKALYEMLPDDDDSDEAGDD